jgi:hypothetical protein
MNSRYLLLRNKVQDMSAMNCQNVRTVIDSASPREAFGEKVSLHLAGCDGCRDYAGQMTALFALMNDVPRVEVPGDFDFRLRARIAQAKAAQSPSNGRGILNRFWVQSFSWAQASAAMAAVALLVSFGTYFAVRNNSQSANNSSPANVAVSRAPVPVNTGQQLPVPATGNSPDSALALSQVTPPITGSNPSPGAKPVSVGLNPGRRGNREFSAPAVTPRSVPEIEISTAPQYIIVKSADGGKQLYVPVTVPAVTHGAQPVLTKTEPKVSSGVTVF